MKELVGWLILVGPVLILLADIVIWLVNAEDTITSVVRGWAYKSPWPEIVYVLGSVTLYLHFFRNFPECLWR